MTEHNDAKILEEPLIVKDVQPVHMDETQPPPLSELASKHQEQGAAWAGGITGLFVGGPIGAILLAWGSWHLAKKNTGDVGDFCRKSGDFMHRVGENIKKEWKESKSANSEGTN